MTSKPTPFELRACYLLATSLIASDAFAFKSEKSNRIRSQEMAPPAPLSPFASCRVASLTRGSEAQPARVTDRLASVRERAP